METHFQTPRNHVAKKKQMWIDLLFSPLYFVLTNVFMELSFHLFVFQNLNISYSLLLCIPTGILAGLICDLFTDKVAKILRYSLTGVVWLVFCTQIVYYRVFSSIMSVSLLGMAGNVIGTFLKDAFVGIYESIPKILFLALPFPLLFFVEKMLRPKSKRRIRNIILVSAAFIVMQIVVLLLLPIGGTASHSPYDLYYNSWSLDLGAEKLGVISATYLDIKSVIFPAEENDTPTPITPVTLPWTEDTETDVSTDEPTGTDTDDTGEPIKPSSPYNVIEGLDFAAMAEKESDETLKSVYTYLNSVQPTKKNEYTGMFEGYNLIMVCAESFSPIAINEELTPTLYKLANSGFVFSNYWTTYESVTTNGEYSYLTGLFPDLAKPKKDGSFLFSATNKNTMNMTICSWFKAKGGLTIAYHPHTGNYYSRKLTHTNLGYTFHAKEDYPDVLTGWPESDLALAKASVNEYIGTDGFLAYIMTVSGHHNYKFGGYNDICDKNKALVQNLTMGTAEGEALDHIRAYVAANIELDRMLEYLIDELEKAGKLDKTVICLSTDHYPYGLTDDEYAKALGYKKASSMKYDRLERYKSSLIIWNSAMETVKVSKPCCTVDVLPTLLNLFGCEYDSRLYSGQDILSSSYGLAILKNESFITEKIAYNSRYSKTYKIDKSFTVTDEYVQAYQQVISNRMSVASTILDYDIFSKFDQTVIAEAQKK